MTKTSTDSWTLNFHHVTEGDYAPQATKKMDKKMLPAHFRLLTWYLYEDEVFLVNRPFPEYADALRARVDEIRINEETDIIDLYCTFKWVKFDENGRVTLD
jgi:hypothetical protein